MNRKDFLYFEEAREILGCGKSFLREELKHGRLPACKLGIKWLIKSKDLERYIENLPTNQVKIKLRKLG